MDRPVLPIHHNLTGKLIFPNGKHLSGCYWFEEIKLFLKKGGKIIKILYSLEYENFDFVFDQYANYFTKIREKGDAFSFFGKNMNNFLYGRMGLTDSEEYTFFITESEFNFYTNWKKYDIKNIIKLNNIYLISVHLTPQVKIDFKLPTNAKLKKNVGIAAAITAKARIKLYSAQDDVIYNNGRLLYSDTDSIFAAYTENVLNETHGSIFWDKLKKNTCIKNAIFINPKTYGLKYHDGTEIIKIKGFDSTSINFKDLEENFLNKKNILQKIKVIARSKFELKQNLVEKVLNLNSYDKRIFTDNYKRTKPIIYSGNTK
jgi:hypothetical protein